MIERIKYIQTVHPCIRDTYSSESVSGNREESSCTGLAYLMAFRTISALLSRRPRVDNDFPTAFVCGYRLKHMSEHSAYCLPPT